jgi:iron complex outermembrane recepter protein
MGVQTRHHLFASTILASTLMFSTVARAQDSTATKPDQTTDAADDTAKPESSREIVVTGSLIRNPNIISSSPVASMNSDEIQFRQTGVAEELLRQLPGAVPSIGQNVNNGNGGASFVNLRGLGSNRNIVLLDGARIVPAGIGGQVNLDNIPLALVQRVDALTGGASTTYGADAVSGVVNFITRKDFSGVELEAGEKVTEKGDGNAYRADLTIGANFDDGRGNAVLSVGYQHADPIYQGARDISVFGISSKTGKASGASFTSVPTTVSFPINNGDLQANPAGTQLVAFYQGFNFNPYNIFSTPFKRLNMYGAGRYEVSDAVEVYARALFSRNTVNTIVAPSGVFGEALTIPGNNPYLNPGIRDQLCALNGIALGATCNTYPAIPLPAVYRRTVELGPRVSEFQTDIFDYRAGLRGNITSSINYDIYGAYGESTNTETQSGYASLSRVQDALNATNPNTCLSGTSSCVPLNLFGQAGSITPAMAGYIGGLTSSTARSATLGQVHGVVSGELSTLPWASKPVTFAIGSEYRKYTAAIKPDSLAQVAGELGGAGGAVTPIRGSYNVKEAFGELMVPLVSDHPFFNELSLEGGIRQSWYTVDAANSPKFSTTTWKAGLSWAPTSGLKLRANYQRSVRAPNIAELFTPSSIGLTNLQIDPCAGAAPTTNANLAAICIAQGAPAGLIGSIQNPSAGQANAYGGGSTSLKPETAKSYTIGAVFTPDQWIRNLSLTIDYYNIVVSNAITSPSPSDAVNACFGTITAASASSPACLAIHRSTSNGRLSGSVATVAGLPLFLSNTGHLETSGIDFAANWRGDLGFAKLSLGLNGNWTNHSRFQSIPTSINRECVGYYSANCASIQPRYQWNQRTTLTFGDLDVSMLWRHTAGVKYEPGLPALFSGTIANADAANSPLAGQTVNFNRIPAYDYFDLSLRARAGEHFEFTATVTNMLNRKPPVVGAQAGSTAFNSGNTFPSTYDAVGRRFAVGAKITF